MPYIETLEDLLDKDGFECKSKDSFLKTAHYTLIDPRHSNYPMFNSACIKVQKLHKASIIEVDIAVTCTCETDEQDDVVAAKEDTDLNDTFLDSKVYNFTMPSKGASVVDLYQRITTELNHLESLYYND